MPVADQLIALVKTQSNFFTAIWQSKKFGLVFLWATSCLLYAEKHPEIAHHCLYAGVAGIVAYIGFQTHLERHVSSAIAENGFDTPKTPAA